MDKNIINIGKEYSYAIFGMYENNEIPDEEKEIKEIDARFYGIAQDGKVYYCDPVTAAVHETDQVLYEKNNVGEWEPADIDTIIGECEPNEYWTI